ncbi:MAG: hypothetical protein MUE53_04430 [Chitinophagales bacterium]|jgi:hypothetical protein|nr:hypothetical protein [Chitinophagales bacterium]
MNKLKFFFLVFLLTTTFYFVSLACGWSEDLISDNSVLTPEAFSDLKSQDFFYDENYSYYNGASEYRVQDRISDSAIIEWASYLKKDPSWVKQVLFYSKPIDFSLLKTPNGLIEFVKTYGKYDISPEAKTYWRLAKEMEFATYFDPWAYYENSPEVKIPSKTVDEITKNLEKTSDKFLKQRYWFQKVRAEFFEKIDPSITFAAYEKEFPKNLLYYRTKSYAAGGLLRSGQTAKANLLYAQIFNACPELMLTAHNSIQVKNPSEWQKSLDLATDLEDKIALWTMRGIHYDDELACIKQIAAINPSHESLKLLAIRYFNRYDNFNEESKPKAKEKLLEIQKIAQNAYQQTSTSNSKTQWRQIESYAAYAQGKYPEAYKLLQDAIKLNPNEKIIAHQSNLLEILYQVLQYNKVKDINENFVTKSFDKFIFDTSEFQKPLVRVSLPTEIVRNHLSSLYAKENKVFEQVAFKNDGKIYDNPNNIRTIYQAITKKNPSAYEKFLEKIYEFNRNDFVKYYAYQYIQNLEFDSALIEISKSKDSITFLGNPFNISIADCNDCEHEKYKGKPYTMKSLVEKMKLMYSKVNMLELSNSATEEEKKELYNNALLLGNAFYNMTHFGTARVLGENNISGFYFTFYEIPKNKLKLIASSVQSRKFYNVALKAAANDEQRAKILFLLAKCDRNDYYVNNFAEKGVYEDKNMPDFIAFEHYKKLYAYSHTKYFQEAIKECGYLAASWKKQKK